MQLSKDSVLAAREWFSVNALQCAEEAKSGSLRVNDIDSYLEDCARRSEEYLAGKWDHTLAFRQKAYYIQTGDCPALLP